MSVIDRFEGPLEESRLILIFPLLWCGVTAGKPAVSSVSPCRALRLETGSGGWDGILGPRGPRIHRSAFRKETAAFHTEIMTRKRYRFDAEKRPVPESGKQQKTAKSSCFPRNSCFSGRGLLLKSDGKCQK